MEDVVISSAVRTPMGGFQGDLDSFSASELGGKAIQAALERARIDRVDEVIMGNVLGAGQGQAPARQASFAAGLDETVPATTLNKMCGSGMKAAMILVSHQVERASSLCDRCVLLEDGLIRWQGDASKAWQAWRASQQGEA